MLVKGGIIEACLGGEVGGGQGVAEREPAGAHVVILTKQLQPPSANSGVSTFF